MKNILKLFLEIIYLIIGTTIFLVVGIIGIVYTFFKHLFKKDYSLVKQLTPLVRSINLINDCFANAAGGELLNDVLKIKGQIRYGKWYQTISAVTGLVRIYERDTKLRSILDKIFRSEHCDLAINIEDRFYWENNFIKETKPKEGILKHL